ncbi:hypothetical protein CW749_27470 [Vibrio sp. vnigr-6D03]|uniref:lysoplasmalogenase family protein n=1 Tax=Vibrio sp. vnigr-6D03 TaxID=2058088 RepID=UPI000C34EC70|nr:lysoplasmalogenase family protein [Vibrio sp. vnigr-6D03]PKF76362.1 hypothetical protein CW749_27470 [Vibrio sp. vnigr-6D03]
MKQSNLIDIATSNASDRAVSFFRPIAALLLCAAIWLTVPFSEPSLWLLVGMGAFGVSELLRTSTSPTSKLSFLIDLFAIVSISGTFWSQLESDIIWWLPAFLFAAGVIVFLLLLPQLDKLLGPISVLGMVLVQLLWASGEVWLTQMSLVSLLGVVGCLILLMSQMTFVLHHFKSPIRNGEAWCSASYFIGLFFISISTIIALNQPLG